MEQKENNQLVNISGQSVIKVNDNSFSDKQQIERAKNLVDKVLSKEETFLTRFFPSKEVKAKREMDAALIKQELGDRNKMLSILRETQIKYFTEAANVFLSDKMIQSKTYLAERLTEAINGAIENLEREQIRFYETLQRKSDDVSNWQGSLAAKFQNKADIEIDELLEKFLKLKYELIDDLHAIKNNLIKWKKCMVRLQF